ncbi:hypothetical protein [Micromonospora sp. NPDC049891]|uniref:hypothetical protein n=1 Tax=Micromonospora sp. NPDC049891 TaxID=3155655 RepID=UPI00340349AF
MNDHPHNLAAAANCWSLRRSWAVWRDTNSSDTNDGLRSTTYGHRGGGGHSDPVADTADTTTRRNHLAEQVREHVDNARWLATSALRHTGMPIGPALAALTNVIDHLDPATAHDVSHHIHQADTAIRRALRLGDDWWPLPGNPKCPGCGTRMLRARTSNPNRAAWPIICTAGCRCTGNTCPCPAVTKFRGTPHIWPGALLVGTLNLEATTVEASA